MSLPTRPGLYRGPIQEYGICQTRENKLTQWTAKVLLVEEFVTGEGWVKPDESGLEITGWFMLEKKNGELNTNNIDSLIAALEYDPNSGKPLLEFLNFGITPGFQVQVQCKIENDQNGQARMKWAFINHYDRVAELPKADLPKIHELENTMGSKLRAYISTKPSQAKPTQQAHAPLGVPRVEPPRQMAAPKMPEAPEHTQQSAWQAFYVAVKGKNPMMTDESITNEWARILGDKSQKMSGQQLLSYMATGAPGEVLPF